MYISCRELGRQQVLAGRRQGQELDLLGSFPSDSDCFQHPRCPLPTHLTQHRGTERKRSKRVLREGVREERGKQRAGQQRMSGKEGDRVHVRR